ncbi:MAG: metalloregulator ArsR/SmtB family transcription factor [Pseudomonadota bacterium]
MSSDVEQRAFRALADPTRREILRLLAVEPRSVGAVVDAFAMTRTAVAKHLAVLEAGRLIRIEAKGRERINHLDAEGLSAARAWLALFDDFWDEKLAALKAAVEKDDAP